MTEPTNTTEQTLLPCHTSDVIEDLKRYSSDDRYECQPLFRGCMARAAELLAEHEALKASHARLVEAISAFLDDKTYGLGLTGMVESHLKKICYALAEAQKLEEQGHA